MIETLLGMGVDPSTLVHVAFIAFALAFLVRDVLWLRVLAMVAYTLHVLRVGILSDPVDQSLVLWYCAFIAINAGHAAWLVYERRLVRLSPAEQGLAMLAFPALDRGTIKRLFRSGKWRCLPPGECLTNYGERPCALVVIVSGEVCVAQDGERFARVGPGHFVGEMSFLTGAPATADTYSDGEVKVFEWDQNALARRCERDPELRTGIYTALGPDLVNKVANARVTAGMDSVSEIQEFEAGRMLRARLQCNGATAYTLVLRLSASHVRILAVDNAAPGERASITLSGLAESRSGVLRDKEGETADLHFDEPLDSASLGRLRARHPVANAA